MQGTELIPAKLVQRKLGGVSFMFIYRRLADDVTFPKPVVLAKRQRFWRIADIDAWIESRAAATTQKNGRPQ